MFDKLLHQILVGGVAAGAVMLLGAAANGAQDNDAKGVAPTPQRLLDVPESHIIPGNIKVEPKIDNPVASDSDAVNRGMNYFAKFNCSGCHAANGAGGMGPALSDRNFKFGREPANIYLTISHGRPTGMPAWGTLLPSNVIWDLVTYIRSISDAPNPQWGKTTSLKSFEIQQVPAEFVSTPNPWQYTEPFSYGQKPTDESKSGTKTQ